MNLLLVVALAFAVKDSADGKITMGPGKQLPQALTISASKRTGTTIIDYTTTIPYLLFVPKNYNESKERFPLLLFLHGSGEAGDGGEELARVRVNGPPKIVEQNRDFPFILVSPQNPPVPESEEETAWNPDELIQLVDHVASSLRVDRKRIYVTGLSMGGYGVWRFAAGYPNRIAAAVSVSGGGQPSWINGDIAKTSIWAFHGAKDTVVPLAEEQAMVDAAKRAGGDVRFTIYPDAGHDSWTETYNNQQVYDWLLAHKLPQ